MTTTDWQTWLTAQIAAANARLTAQTGTASLCEIGRAGGVTGGLKYEEGRLAALFALRRLPPADRAALAAEHARWRAELARQQAQPRPAPSWVAYAQGALDACAAALALVEGQITPGG